MHAGLRACAASIPYTHPTHTQTCTATATEQALHPMGPGNVDMRLIHATAWATRASHPTPPHGARTGGARHPRVLRRCAPCLVRACVGAGRLTATKGLLQLLLLLLPVVLM